MLCFYFDRSIVLQQYLHGQRLDRIVKWEIKNKTQPTVWWGLTHIEKALQRLFQRKVHDQGKIYD